MLAPTERFSSRVANYIRYRPSYPHSILTHLQRHFHLQPKHRIADIGSGTGILSEIFLKNGNYVWGVEPNHDMRHASERLLKEYSNFKSIDGSAEATTLPELSVDWIVAGQAFHWFDANAAKSEFLRILKPKGYVALLWNLRKRTSDSLMDDYENIIETYGTDYADVSMNPTDSFFTQYFTHCNKFQTDFSQTFNWNEFLGRALSSSYVPQDGHPLYAPMVDALKKAFDKHQKENVVHFDYETVMYCGLVA